ncbi:hypothetical protein ACQUKI_20805 [Ralstonia pseudosolanacearum]
MPDGIFRVYLKSSVRPGNPVISDKSQTSSRAAALAAFAELVGRTEFDGQLRAAVLSHNNQQIAYHRFDREPGDADYWRDAKKLAELEHTAAPQHGGKRLGSGRPTIGDARHNVTLPADVAGYLRELGGGGLSAGIIEAVRRLRG